MPTDDQLDRLRADIDARLPDYLADLRRLVDVDCGTYNAAGVNEVGGFFAELLRASGANVEVIPGQRLGDTSVARWEGRADGPSVLLIGHLDTVFPDGTVAERPFRTHDGRAYGPGVSDMKSGLLTGLYAIRALRALAGDGQLGDGSAGPFRQLAFVVNPDEEVTSPESTPVIRREAAGSDVVLVLESARANGDIVSSRKGAAEFILRMRGRAAHAGVEPEKGRSAIVEAAHKTIALAALNGRWADVTVNVGLIDGGTRPNVVAAEAMVHLDVRAVTQATMAEAAAEIERIAASSTVPDVSCLVEHGYHFPPMEKSAGTAQLAERAIALAARLGFALRDTATGGASDANTTAGMGVPTLDGLGPIGGNDHSPDEYLELDSIVPRTTLLATLLLDIARAGPPPREG